MKAKCDGDTKQYFSDVLPIAIRLLCIPRFGTVDLRPKFLLPTPYALVNNSIVKLERFELPNPLLVMQMLS